MAAPIKLFKDSEDKIATLDVVDGQLMFVTDSKKILLDDGTQRKTFNKTGNDSYVEHNEPKAKVNDVWYIVEGTSSSPIYGIKRQVNSSDSKWIRIDDAAGKVANAIHSNEELEAGVINDFDDIYPWSDIYTYSYDPTTKEEIRYTDPTFSYESDYVFTKIPEFYWNRYQIEEDGELWEYIKISKEEQEGFYYSPAFSIARYILSSGYKSKSGVRPLVNQMLSTNRAGITSVDPSFSVLDYHFWLIQLLYLVEYADYNSQAVLGPGITSVGDTVNSGGCNKLEMKSGSLTMDGKSSVSYRGMEDLYANENHFVDGVAWYADNKSTDSQTGLYIIENKKDYSDTLDLSKATKINLEPIASSSDYAWAEKMGYDSNYPLAMLPISYVEGEYENSYVTDCVYGTSPVIGLDSFRALRIGGYYGETTANGLFTWNLTTSSGSATSGSSRSTRIVKTEIKSFADATDEELAKYLQMHYEGKINLANYWSVGDTRKIHLNSIANPNINGYTDTWDAQDITIVITALNHHDLATPINGITKAAITVQTRECLNNLSQGGSENGCVFANLNNDYDMTFTNWSQLPLRTWMNGKFLTTCFSSDWQNMIKETKHKRLTQYNDKTTEEVIDKLFLPSYPEIFGNTSYSHYLSGATPAGEEGTQWDYYKTSSNRVKKGNNNGSANSTSCYWWEGSVSSNPPNILGYTWCNVGSVGSANINFGDTANGLAPAFCL